MESKKDEWHINETSYAVQIAKTGISWISVLCEVPIYQYSDIELVRQQANDVLKIINAHDELVKALKDAQEATMHLINMTETGVKRNLLCDLNINISMALQKVYDTESIEI